MKLNELIDNERLVELILQKYVSVREHPTLPLAILNYTPAATEVKPWDHTLSYCRGLVYDTDNYDVIAVPFKKFWNYNDPAHPETLLENLPKFMPTIYEKVDGSYLNLFFYKGQYVVSTRGSFESEQAKWADKWVGENIDVSVVGDFDRIFNYIFEVVIPEDKKVVDYYFSGIVLLGATTTQRNGFVEEFAPKIVQPQRFLRNLWIAEEYPYEDLDKLQARNLDNEEGYVATWHKTYGSAFRVKLKFETYKLLHRMYFQTTPEVIWELVKKGENVREYLVGADERLLNWSGLLADKIQRNYFDVKAESMVDFKRAIEHTNYAEDCAPGGLQPKSRRKTFAFHATQTKNPGLLFLIYDAKIDQYDEAIWKLVKPENVKAFKEDNETEN